MAQPDFLKPVVVLCSAAAAADVGVAAAAGGADAGPPAGFVNLIPAALASLRSSFSSRLRSFSLRSSTDPLNVAFCAACMSRKRAL